MVTKKRQADHSNAAESSDSNAENEAKTNGCNCPHLGKALVASYVRKEISKNCEQECLDCKRSIKNGPIPLSDGTADAEKVSLLVCLRCGQCRCETHGENHSTNKQGDAHDIAYNYEKDVVWCFKCKKDIQENHKVLFDCVEIVKKSRRAMKSPIKSTSSKETDVGDVNYSGSFVISTLPTPSSDILPRVRGLANLGNTCFFNSVMQCLAQTPFLVDVLEEMRDDEEKFSLAGGEVQIGEEKINLDPLEGTLKGLQPSTLTHSLINALRELQKGSGDVYVPNQLKDKLHEKCPQFAGYDQHDAHELLRQLLETVRNEDLDRYKKAILQELDLQKRSNRESITDQQAREVKAYGRQASDLLLRPSQVFRGELVSTLQRISCGHTTDHVEHFLDLSLPVSADKPVHSRRRANSETCDTNKLSKHQLKKEKRAAHKRKYKHVNTTLTPSATTEQVDNPAQSDSSGDDSDADNEEDVEPTGEPNHEVNESGYSSEKLCNGDSGCGSPSETQIDQTAAGEPMAACELTGQLDENSPLLQGCALDDAAQAQALPSLAPAQNPRNKPLVLNFSAPIPLPPPSCPSPAYEEGINSGMDRLIVGAASESTPDSDLSAQARTGGCEHAADTPLDSECHGDCARALSPVENTDADEVMDGDLLEEVEKSTLAERVTGSTTKCTLITCLNSFTAVELLTNNNKVSCDECTDKVSKNNPGKGNKTVYSDASKQLLILNPPAILILHLKRFQVQRLMFSRKNSETVTFEPTLDLAAYCSVKCKNSGLVRKDQGDIRYALYGIVQHSGGMHGGHYVAHVKVRKALARDDPRWAFLAPGPSKTGKLEEIGASEPPAAPPGKWYYVSDSHVSETREARVLDSEAYLLFYERIW